MYTGPVVPVYLDCNATTPMEPAVADAVTTCMLEEYGNAGSRTHDFGARAKATVEHARTLVAVLLQCQRDEVLFTSGATEANNLAILGLAQHGESVGKRHIVTTAIEHKAVLAPIEQLQRRGFSMSLVQPTQGGWVDPASLRNAIQPDTLLVSVQHVNNETGVEQPLDEIATELESSDAYFHVDAAQGFGKILPPLRHPRIDLISLSAHKLYGPKGVGALIARKRARRRPPLTPLVYGGGQERGLRAGTLPVPLIVGLGAAADLAAKNVGDRTERCRAFRQRALASLVGAGAVLHGDQQRCLPHVANLSFPGVDSEALIVAWKGIVAVSNGSACTSHSYTPSHVLQAMRLPTPQVQGAVRLSWCHLTPEPDWSALTSAVRRLVE